MIDFSRWIVSVDRPSWDEAYLKQANDIKERSIDANTKHGCILTNENNHIVSTGYNSFPIDFPDEFLPNYRFPEETDCYKYDFMIHAEANAVCNLTTKNYSRLTCYMTGKPCITCLKLLRQIKVDRIVLSNTYGWGPGEEEKECFDIILYYSRISMETLNQKYVFYTEESPQFNGRWINKCSPC